MSDKTNATERIRQLLDDRGVEYSREGCETFFKNVHIWAINNKELCISISGLSPEQAAEATLGRGTCRKVRAWEDDPRGGGGWVLVCSECDEFLANDGEDGEFDGPNFCPNCGRKVVK